jgi:hypothetical protein
LIASFLFRWCREIVHRLTSWKSAVNRKITAKRSSIEAQVTSEDDEPKGGKKISQVQGWSNAQGCRWMATSSVIVMDGKD